MATLEFFYDVVSPYSYLAATQVEAIASDCGATLVWKPLLLGGLFKAIGNEPPADLVPRGRYLLKDLHRWATYYRVPLKVSMHWPGNSIRAQRVLAGAAEHEIADLTHRLMHAFWVDDLNLADDAAIEAVVGAEAFARALEQPAKDRLRALTDEAHDRGVFGAPTMFVGDEMFFGNDRLPFVEQVLRDAG